MVDWLHDPATTRKPLTDTRLREKARSIAKDLDISEEKFKASSGWVDNFKHRHGIRNGDWVGDGRNTKLARALGLGNPVTPLAKQIAEQEAAKKAASSTSNRREEPSTSPSYSTQLVPSQSQQQWSEPQPVLPTPDHSPVEQHSLSRISHSPVTEDSGLHIRDQNPYSSSHSDPSPSVDVQPHNDIIQSTSALSESYSTEIYRHSRTESLIAPGMNMQTSSSVPPHNTPIGEIEPPMPPMPHIPDNSIPTIHDADEAINRVITFFELERRKGTSFITPEQAGHLQKIKLAIFCAIGGFPVPNDS